MLMKEDAFLRVPVSGDARMQFFYFWTYFLKILTQTSCHVGKSAEILKSEELRDLQYEVLFYPLTSL